jgi:hypothetical protein
MPFAREAEVVLALWREAERKIENAGAEDIEALQAEILLLRTEYERLNELARQYHRAVPPPLPEGRATTRGHARRSALGDWTSHLGPPLTFSGADCVVFGNSEVL